MMPDGVLSIVQPMLGGALIGASAIVLLALNGRIAGISGIVGGIVSPQRGDIAWRVCFVAGLVVGGFCVGAVFADPFRGIRATPYAGIGLAGLLVGFGARLGNGCTSGHGVCGVGRVVATVDRRDLHVHAGGSAHGLRGSTRGGRMAVNGVAAFVVGVTFALGLGIGGMTQPARVLAFLDVGGAWDPSLAYVMLRAIIVYGVGFPIVTRRERPTFGATFVVPSRRDVDRRLIGGALVFGVGWGLAGTASRARAHRFGER